MKTNANRDTFIATTRPKPNVAAVRRSYIPAPAVHTEIIAVPYIDYDPLWGAQMTTRLITVRK